MTWYRAAVTNHYFTALPKDVAVNNLYFTDTGSSPAGGTMDLIATQINAAWGFIDEYRAACLLDTGGLSIKFYDVQAPPGASPVGVYGPFNVGAPTTVSNLPLEVCAVASFRGALVPGTNPARRRGRNYIGPLNPSAADLGNSTDFPNLTGTFRTALLDYMNALWDVNSVSPFATWCVYSPSDNEMVPVTYGWVDSDFDTQRRRQATPEARSTRTFS